MPTQVVLQHLGDGRGGKADVNKRQVAEEGVHGVVEVRVRDDGQDGEQVPQAPNRIQAAEQPKEHLLLLGLLREAEEDEFRDSGLIVHVWAVLKPEARA